MANARGKTRRLAVLTSGGDCPGLNAGLRAVVRAALHHGFAVLGVQRGYRGLLAGRFTPMDSTSVGGIINRGGTILGTSRCEDFEKPENLRRAAARLDGERVDALVVFGGDGSLRGAEELSRRCRAAVIGVPKSIDNDVGGTDYAIGFDTAVNTVVSAIDKIRDTAASHERLFLVEVMGRDHGFLALAAGLAGGAEEIVVPETPTDPEALCRRLRAGRARGKRSSIVVVAEGDEAGGAFKLAERMRGASGFETRVSVLGYEQRGGTPSAFDRILAARLGHAAVAAAAAGRRSVVVGLMNGRLRLSPLRAAWARPPRLNKESLRVAAVVSGEPEDERRAGAVPRREPGP